GRAKGCWRTLATSGWSRPGRWRRPASPTSSTASPGERKSATVDRRGGEIETKVAEGIHRVTQGVVNFYVVEGSDGLTIVDAGTPRDWDALLSELATIGAQLADVRAILLTHAHSDHTGFAE